MVRVICDTSFLIHIANTRIKNISNIDVEIGNIEYVIPSIVLKEIESLSKDEKKGKKAKSTMAYIKNFKKIEISGTFADKAIMEHVKTNGGIVATMDKELKNKIKNQGGSIISISNDRIILEQ